MRHELRHVRAFLKVAELESFTRAATELHVSQSALTVQVQQLEEELGVRLFDRNKRGVAITDGGRDLLGPLQRLVADTEAIVNHARDIAAVRAGSVAIAALPTVAANLLPHVQRIFLQSNPEIKITVQDVVADRVREAVAKRAVDFGLGTASKQDNEIIATALYRDHLAAFLDPAHKLAKHAEVTLRELAGCSLILPNRESSVRRLFEATLTCERVSIAVRYETNYMPTALAMVREGLGVAILPESASEGTPRNLIRVAIRRPAMSRQICLLQRRDRTLSPAAEKFVHVLRNEAAGKTK